MTRKQIASLILLGASILYDALPVDIIPDIPFIGWIDDMLVTSTAAINCLQQFSAGDSPLANKILTWLKWTCIILLIIVIISVALLAGTIASLFK